jgi:hypothetical protein
MRDLEAEALNGKSIVRVPSCIAGGGSPRLASRSSPMIHKDF